MSRHPILLVGGSGVIGRWTARCLCDAHPAAPLLIGGRDLARPQRAATEIGGAEGVTLGLAADDLGLGGRPVSAVAVLFRDHGAKEFGRVHDVAIGALLDDEDAGGPAQATDLQRVTKDE